MVDPVIPVLTSKTEGDIVIIIPSTQAQVSNQGNTYNQAGITYNQANTQYEGVYNYNQDVIPLVTSASLQDFQSLELFFTDIYTPFVPPPVFTNIPIGPDFSCISRIKSAILNISLSD